MENIMSKANRSLAVLVVIVLAGVGLLGIATPTARADRDRDVRKEGWYHYKARWTYWSEPDRSWYYTDGKQWYFRKSDDDEWRRYRFNRSFGKGWGKIDDGVRRDFWQNYKGYWDYWSEADQRWYHTDGKHWFFRAPDSDDWRLYRFDKEFGKGWERREYKHPGERARYDIPRHGIYRRP